ncbi:MAG TPA: ribose-5-phosphate isomerase RpiA [Erysipelothrix sp.]|nr:ribose-5-phosphate isomerase RpiA [Erysipelothrix sp.]
MNLKKKVGIESAKYVKDGMVVGLGTGSTAYYMIEELGRRMKEENLQITGVPTSSKSKAQAESLNIPLKDINEVPYIDITIDGADEFDDNFDGIKGGGGALLFEKVVANMSKNVIWIVDETKHVKPLGHFPLPIEVIPFGSQALFVELALKGYRPEWRMDGDKRYLTDSNNYILDLHVEKIEDAPSMADDLKSMIGVVEHGLFIGLTDMVIMATKDGLKTLGTLKNKQEP